MASDLSLTPLTSASHMQIAIVTGSDRPRFPAGTQEFVVGSNTPVGNEIGTVKADGRWVLYIIGEYTFLY